MRRSLVSIVISISLISSIVYAETELPPGMSNILEEYLEGLELEKEKKVLVRKVLLKSVFEIIEIRKKNMNDNLKFFVTMAPVLRGNRKKILKVLNKEEGKRFKKRSKKYDRLIVRKIYRKDGDKDTENKGPGSGFPPQVLNLVYGKVPHPKWNRDQFSGSLSNSFTLPDSWKLVSNIKYDEFHIYRDKNHPKRLHKAYAGLIATGPGFFTMASLSYRSDGFFISHRSLGGLVVASGDVYRNGPHSISIGVFYSSLVSFDILGNISIPLPTMAYSYISTPAIVSLGIPLVFILKPVKKLSIFIFGMFPLTARFRISYKVASFLKISAGYNYKKESFQLNKFPYKDLDYVYYLARRSVRKGEKYKNFIFERHRAGLTLTITTSDYFDIIIYNGFQFSSSYAFNDNTMTYNVIGKKNVPDTYIFNIVCTLKFGSKIQGGPGAMMSFF